FLQIRLRNRGALIAKGYDRIVRSLGTSGVVQAKAQIAFGDTDNSGGILKSPMCLLNIGFKGKLRQRLNAIGKDTEEVIGPEVTHIENDRNAMPASVFHGDAAHLNGRKATEDDVGRRFGAQHALELPRLKRMIEQTSRRNVLCVGQGVQQANLKLVIYRQ